MVSATPDLRTYDYLPSRKAPPLLDRYQIILLGGRGSACEQLAQGCYLNVERPRVEPAIF